MNSLFSDPLSYALLWPILICEAFRNLMVMLHVVAMEIRALRGCREAFVLLSGCEGLQNRRGRPGMKNFTHRVSCHSDFCFWENGGKLLRTRLLCENSRKLILFTDTAVIKSQSCSIKYIFGKSKQLPKAAACSVEPALWKPRALRC